MRLARQGLCLALALALCACSRCEKPAAARHALTRYLPKDADAALVLPDLGILGDRFGLLAHLKIASFLAGTQGFSSADELLGSLVAQAGIDLRSKEALEKAGIDPARGLAIALLADGDAYSVVGILDEARFKAALAGLARTRLGAGEAGSRTEGALSVLTFSRGAGQEPQLAAVLREGVAFIAAAPSAAKVGRWAGLSPEASLDAEPALQGSLQRLGGPRDFYAFAPSTSSYLRPQGLPAVTVVGALGAPAFTLRADMPWPNTRASLRVLDKKDGPSLLGELPPDAFGVAKFSGDPSLLGPFWPTLVGPFVAKAAQDAAFDVKAEVLDNLEPGGSLALVVAPTARLGAGLPELDVRRTNPFQFVQVVIAARVKDPSKAQATLEKVPPVAARFGAQVTPSERGGKKVFLTRYSQGEGTDFALVGRDWVMAAPVSQLDAALSRLATPMGGPGPLRDPGLRAALDEHAASAVLDLKQLAESVRALPSEAWGIGGFAIKATTVRWLDATDDLRAVTVSLSEKDGALEGELSLRFAPK